MEQTSFELTPKQKGILTTLSRETGKPVPALLDAALEGLQRREHSDHNAVASSPLPDTPKPIWQQFAEAFDDVPEEELARLPTDLAAQVDHYVYGLPKR